MTEEDYKLWAQIDPETLAKLMSMGTLDERSALLGQEHAQGIEGIDYQLAQAAALRRPSGTQYTNPTGAALGGIGDLLRQLGGGFMENRAMGERKALLDRTTGAQRELLGQKDRGREDYARAMANALRARFGPQPERDENGVALTPFTLPARPQVEFGEPVFERATDHAGHGMLAKRSRPVGFGLDDLRTPFGFL